jgi:ribosomal protein S18 acetylase RimI-like enzyme
MTSRVPIDSSQVALRPLVASDFAAVARLHVATFPGTSLAVMGPLTVERYYQWWFERPQDVQGDGAFYSGELTGFFVGGVFRRSVSQFFGEQRAFLLRQAVQRPWIAFNPMMRRGWSKMLRDRMRRSKAMPPVSGGRVAPTPYKILTIAVDQDYQGLGLGKQLMAAAENQARRKGFSEMVLDVITDNEQAIRFYEALGWLRIEKQGGWRGQMRKPLT